MRNDAFRSTFALVRSCLGQPDVTEMVNLAPLPLKLPAEARMARRAATICEKREPELKYPSQAAFSSSTEISSSVTPSHFLVDAGDVPKR
jgi:hypothetical protein